jgi:hypothetical protein
MRHLNKSRSSRGKAGPGLAITDNLASRHRYAARLRFLLLLNRDRENTIAGTGANLLHVGQIWKTEAAIETAANSFHALETTVLSDLFVTACPLNRELTGVTGDLDILRIDTWHISFDHVASVFLVNVDGQRPASDAIRRIRAERPGPVQSLVEAPNLVENIPRLIVS